MNPQVAPLLERVLGPDLPVAIRAWDGSRTGPADAPATVVLKSPVALRRLLGAPNDLGFGRAYVAGDLDVEGDLYAVLELREHVQHPHVGPKEIREAVQILGKDTWSKPELPPQEVRLSGRRHSKSRDAAAISYHYDVSNAFYRMVLGPTMTYSCGVWPEPDTTLDEAQFAKYELISRKLGLQEGMRLLDVGCGWGGMLLHAAREHGVSGVGVTISTQQADLAAKRVAEAGLTDKIKIRVQDYRDIDDGPFDAISSIGMFEHVGEAKLGGYFTRMKELLAPGGRFLNHGISQAPRGRRPLVGRAGFVGRYVFPDGELLEVGTVVTAMQENGFEVRNVENLREHYARTLRAWVDNLEDNWDDAVAEVGEGRARVWRLYMAGSAVGFEAGVIQIHQTLAVHHAPGSSGLPARPDWDTTPLVG
ncbi:MAG: cfa [Actinomycetia bacterium]|nr:cfa [Actinomycetes bacterium]